MVDVRRSGWVLGTSTSLLAISSLFARHRWGGTGERWWLVGGWRAININKATWTERTTGEEED
jgi:hypothetical protein